MPVDHRPLPLAVLILSLAAAGLPAQAQQPLRSGVTVDEGVLDALGPEPSLAARLLPDTGQRYVTTPIQMVAPGTARALRSGTRATSSVGGPRPAPSAMPRSGLTIAASAAPSRIEPPAPPPSIAGANDVYRSPVAPQAPVTQFAAAPSQAPAVSAPQSSPARPAMAQPPQISASVPPMPTQGQADPGPRPAYPAPRATSAEPTYPPPPRPSTVPPGVSLPLSVEPAYKSRAGLAPSVSAPTPVDTPVAAPTVEAIPAAPPTVAATAPAAAPARPAPVAQPAPPPPSPIPVAAPPPPPMPASPPPATRPAPAPVQQTASAAPLPARPAPTNGGRIGFDSGSTDLSPAARGELDRIATQLGTDEDRRLLVEAYAQKTADSESDARRLSLDRALMVRSYLGERGIRTTRIDVKALGSRTSDAADRADLTIVSGQ